MTLSDLLPNEKDLEGIEGVERSLLQRRKNGTLLTATLAVLTAAVQVVLLLGKYVEFPKKGETLSWTAVAQALWGPEGIVLGVAFLAVVAFVAMRYSSFLFEQSKEPFRYTFCVQPFKRIKDTPGDRFTLEHEDLLNLVQHDLRERLNGRIGRLSLLDHGPDPKTATKALSEPSGDGSLATHIHIAADYALREEKNGEWTLQVFPRVRIGSEANPYALAFPVRYPLEASAVPSPEGVAPAPSTEQQRQQALLTVGKYEQLVERVYSSVATEMYRQIKSDVDGKMGMFPTSYLRAVARYYEARDFEKSNTIDSYDRAIELYEAARADFSTSRLHQFKRLLFGLPIFALFLPAVCAEARTKLGYARCQIYRRVASELAGRRQKPLFEIRHQLHDARDLFRICYNRIVPAALRLAPEATTHGLDVPQERAEVAEERRYKATRAILTVSDDGPWKRRRQLYLSLREELCEAYAVTALGYSRLRDHLRARDFVDTARAFDPQTDSIAALVLLARSSIENNLTSRIALLRRAKELAPDSEIVRYRLAVSFDMLARRRDEITVQRTEALRQEYESVLRINPGNIAALIGQGYLLWLIKDLDGAERVFTVGHDLQAMVSQTFVGDLEYGFARVAAEKAALAIREFATARGEAEREAQLRKAASQAYASLRAYEEAVTADPAVAACYSVGSSVLNAYYEFIAPSMLERYRSFAADMLGAKRAAVELGLLDKGRGGGIYADALETVLSYALNDHGNASLSYSLRFEFGPRPREGKPHLETALARLREAVRLRDENYVAHYNLAVTLS